MYIKAHLIRRIMSKTLKHHKRKQRRANKTQRRHKAYRMSGGNDFVFNGNQSNMDELNALMMRPDHHVLAKHYSDTCTHCKNLEPEWEKVVRQLTPHPSLTIANLDPNATDYMNEHHYSKHNYGVDGVPTIVYIHKINLVKPQEYQGARTAKAINEWFTKILADNNIEMSIKPKSHPSEPAFEEPPVSEEPVSEPHVFEEPVSEPPVSEEPISEPVSEEPVSEPPVSEEPSLDHADTLANVFPPAPVSVASSTLSNATQAVKDAASKMNQTISNGVESVKSALTTEFDVGEKLKTLFSSSSASAPVPPRSQNQDIVSHPVNAPLVPSLVGGIRKCTRRKNRRSKPNKKSKKSKSKK